MKSYNILRTIFLLLTNGSTTIKALAEDLEVSTRTVKRYIGTIEGLGMPIETVPGRNGGICFKREEFHEQFGVGAKELDHFLDAIYSNQSLDVLFQGRYLDFSQFLRKLKVNTAVEIDFSKWSKNVEDDKNFLTIKRAVSTLRQIEFDYYDMYNHATHRVIDPYKIGFKENSWYILGVCHLRNDVRTFKMRKMQNVQILETSFIKRDDVDFDFTSYYSNSLKVDLVLKISKKAAAKMYEDFEDYEIKEQEDGFLVKSKRIRGPSLLPLILSYGRYAKVMEPQEVIDDLTEHIEHMKKIYER